MGLEKNGRWRIDNDLLHELLTYGDGSPGPIGLRANWSIGHGFDVVKGLITWLVMRALNIQRLPWMTDSTYAAIPYEYKRLELALQYFLKYPDMVDDACAEIKAIYDHTQEWFAKQGQAVIRLGRGYKNDKSSRIYGEYANTLLRQAEAATHLELNMIEVPHDVITSWGSSCEYTACVAGVEMDIPIGNILCGADTLEPRENAHGRNAMESGEWLVLNRRLDGLMKLPVAAIRPLRGHQVKPVMSSDAQSVLDERIPVVRCSALLNCGHLNQPRVKQSLSTRIGLAWDILKTPFH